MRVVLHLVQERQQLRLQAWIITSCGHERVPLVRSTPNEDAVRPSSDIPERSRTAQVYLGDVAGTRWAFLLSAVSFVGAALLALGLPSTWPLLVARIVLICLGVALLVIGLRQRKLRKRRNNGQAARAGPI